MFRLYLQFDVGRLAKRLFKFLNDVSEWEVQTLCTAFCIIYRSELLAMRDFIPDLLQLQLLSHNATKFLNRN